MDEKSAKRLKSAGISPAVMDTLSRDLVDYNLVRGFAHETLTVEDVLYFFRTSKKHWQMNTALGLKSFWAKAFLAFYAVKDKKPYNNVDSLRDFLNRIGLNPADVNYLQLFIASKMSPGMTRGVFKRNYPFTAHLYVILHPEIPMKSALRYVTVVTEGVVVNWRNQYPQIQNDVEAVMWRAGVEFSPWKNGYIVQPSSLLKFYYMLLNDGWYGIYRMPMPTQGKPLYLRNVAFLPSFVRK